MTEHTLGERVAFWVTKTGLFLGETVDNAGQVLNEVRESALYARDAIVEQAVVWGEEITADIHAGLAVLEHDYLTEQGRADYLHTIAAARNKQPHHAYAILIGEAIATRSHIEPHEHEALGLLAYAKGDSHEAERHFDNTDEYASIEARLAHSSIIGGRVQSAKQQERILQGAQKEDSFAAGVLGLAYLNEGLAHNSALDLQMANMLLEKAHEAQPEERQWTLGLISVATHLGHRNIADGYAVHLSHIGGKMTQQEAGQVGNAQIPAPRYINRTVGDSVATALGVIYH